MTKSSSSGVIHSGGDVDSFEQLRDMAERIAEQLDDAHCDVEQASRTVADVLQRVQRVFARLDHHDDASATACSRNELEGLVETLVTLKATCQWRLAERTTTTTTSSSSRHSDKAKQRQRASRARKSDHASTGDQIGASLSDEALRGHHASSRFDFTPSTTLEQFDAQLDALSSDLAALNERSEPQHVRHVVARYNEALETLRAALPRFQAEQFHIPAARLEDAVITLRLGKNQSALLLEQLQQQRPHHHHHHHHHQRQQSTKSHSGSGFSLSPTTSPAELDAQIERMERQLDAAEARGDADSADSIRSMFAYAYDTLSCAAAVIGGQPEALMTTAELQQRLHRLALGRSRCQELVKHVAGKKKPPRKKGSLIASSSSSATSFVVDEPDQLAAPRRVPAASSLVRRRPSLEPRT